MIIHYVLKRRINVLNVIPGFTYIEMLLNLAITLVICSVIPLIIMNIQHFTGRSTNHQDVNFEMFLKESYSEIQEAEKIEVIDNVMTLSSGEDKITYAYHNNRIVRKVNGSGYIIMLENVYKAEYKNENGNILLEMDWLSPEGRKHEIWQIT